MHVVRRIQKQSIVRLTTAFRHRSVSQPVGFDTDTLATLICGFAGVKSQCHDVPFVGGSIGPAMPEFGQIYTDEVAEH